MRPMANYPPRIPDFGSLRVTPREKRRHTAGREEKCPAASRLFSRGVIFTRARISLALLFLRKNGGLLVVYR